MKHCSEWEALTTPTVEPGRADDTEGLGVFVPGLMGAGILISGIILVSDGIRHLLPSRGVRRRIKVVRGVRRIVVDLADAAGIAISERNLIRRVRRPVWVYLFAAAVLLPLAYLAARWGINAYSATGSALEGNAIAIFYGFVAAVALGATGIVSLVLSVRFFEPLPVRWVVAHTPFGRLAPPPYGVAERARLLIPSLDKGASK